MCVDALRWYSHSRIICIAVGVPDGVVTFIVVRRFPWFVWHGMVLHEELIVLIKLSAIRVAVFLEQASSFFYICKKAGQPN